MIDTPEGIAFARAAARNGALKMELRGMTRSSGRTVYSIVKDVYGFSGNRQVVSQMLDEYVEGTLTIRAWTSEYIERMVAIVNEATRRAEEEYGAGYTKDTIDGNVQAAFESGAITEQEGNDACLFLYVQVVQRKAGGR